MNKIETIISSESKYLNRLKLIQSQETGWPSMPATAPVLAMFLADFRPADERAARGDNMTSAEIIGAMEDICAFSTSEVAIVMSYLGYRLSVKCAIILSLKAKTAANINYKILNYNDNGINNSTSGL